MSYCTTSPRISHHISKNEPPHLQQCATTAVIMSHQISKNELLYHIPNNEPPHIQQWAIKSPRMRYNISKNEPPNQQGWATKSPRMSYCTTSPTMSYHNYYIYYRAGGGDVVAGYLVHAAGDLRRSASSLTTPASGPSATCCTLWTQPIPDRQPHAGPGISFVNPTPVLFRHFVMGKLIKIR